MFRMCHQVFRTRHLCHMSGIQDVSSGCHMPDVQDISVVSYVKCSAHVIHLTYTKCSWHVIHLSYARCSRHVICLSYARCSVHDICLSYARCSEHVIPTSYARCSEHVICQVFSTCHVCHMPGDQDRMSSSRLETWLGVTQRGYRYQARRNIANWKWKSIPLLVSDESRWHENPTSLLSVADHLTASSLADIFSHRALDDASINSCSASSSPATKNS